MKLILNTLFLLATLLIYENKVYALTDYQIRQICQPKKKRFTCIKDLKYKRYNLLKGNRIKIPVIPYKR